MNKPIGPAAHGALDYGFAAAQIAAPDMLGLGGAARGICYAFAATTAILNGLTDHPLGIKRVIPLRLHGKFETPFLAALLVVPWAAGAMKEPKERNYFLSFFALATTNYLLTDYDAGE